MSIEMGSFIIDAVLILIVVFMFFSGRKKGFFKMFFSLVATAVAVLIAREYCAPVAEWANETFIRSAAINTFTEAINFHLSNGTQAIIDAIPDYIAKAAQAGGIVVSDIISNIGSSIDASQAAEQIYGGIYSVIVSPLLSVIAFVLIYFIANALLSFVISFINKIFKLPVLRKLNESLGGLAGVLKGIAIVIVISTVLVSLSPFLPEEISLIIDSSKFAIFLSNLL